MERQVYACLALFVLQFIILMFYLELFELNFWGLNKNTRRNIQERERKEMLKQERDQNSSERTSVSSDISGIDISPDYILISFTISRIINIVMERQVYSCLALFVLQFITLMFYLELFELNFLGLNKNTRRNIQERERKEMLKQERDQNSAERTSVSSDVSGIDISPDYVIYQREINSSSNDISSPKYEMFKKSYELYDNFE